MHCCNYVLKLRAFSSRCVRTRWRYDGHIFFPRCELAASLKINWTPESANRLELISVRLVKSRGFSPGTAISRYWDARAKLRNVARRMTLARHCWTLIYRANIGEREILTPRVARLPVLVSLYRSNSYLLARRLINCIIRSAHCITSNWPPRHRFDRTVHYNLFNYSLIHRVHFVYIEVYIIIGRYAPQNLVQVLLEQCKNVQ